MPLTLHALIKLIFQLQHMDKTKHIYMRFLTAIVPFSPHGLTKVNSHLHRMEITKLLHITFCFHRTDYRNCSVYTARNTIVPFTPHRLTKVNFYLHHIEITKLLHITSPFTPHGIQKPLCFHRTKYNCAIYTAWLSKS